MKSRGVNLLMKLPTQDGVGGGLAYHSHYYRIGHSNTCMPLFLVYRFCERSKFWQT